MTPDKLPIVPAPVPPAPDPAGAANAPTPLDPTLFSESHRALLADGAIQFDLPMRPPPPPPDPPPAWLEWLIDFFSSDHPGLRVSLWLLAGLFALAIVALVVMRMRGMDWPWRRPAEAEAGEDWRPEAQAARTLLGEADALAAAGRFSEAAHLLLFRSIEDVEERRPELIRKSLTARDIAGLPAIPPRPRGAFMAIAMLVERAFFARRDLGEPEWRECRTAYEEFAFAEAWR